MSNAFKKTSGTRHLFCYFLLGLDINHREFTSHCIRVDKHVCFKLLLKKTSTQKKIGLKCSFEIDLKETHAPPRPPPPPLLRKPFEIGLVVFNLSHSRLARIRMDI